MTNKAAVRNQLAPGSRCEVIAMYESLIQELRHVDGLELLTALIKHEFHGRIAMVSSFGAESAVLLHMVANIDRSTPVITLDTGKLFTETIRYRSHLVELLGLTDVRVIKPAPDTMRFLDGCGLLHRNDPDMCCRIRKAEPLKRALAGFHAWISGRKRYHGGLRANIPTLQVVDDRLKVEPLARFTRNDIDRYIKRHELPRHPLAEEGYLSIGCWPCTARSGTIDNPRAGRWAGLDKTECGIHWSLNGQANGKNPAIAPARRGRELGSGVSHAS